MDQTLNTASAAESLPLFKDILALGADLRVRVTGRSMVPFLHGGEVLIIRKVPCSSLKRGDVIFFRNQEGFPVVHRIVRRENYDNQAVTFQTKGDALNIPDEPVRDTEVLGKVCAVENGPGCLNLDTGIGSTINYLLAMFSLFESRLSLVARAVKHAVRACGMGGTGSLPGKS